MQSVTAQPLERLLAGVPAKISGDARAPITSLAVDSRKVHPGALFFCLQGERDDGHDFAAAALRAGAAAIVAQREITGAPALVIVPDALAALAAVAVRFYDNPSAALTVIGITGTNGKTTTSHFIESIAKAAGLRFGIIGTLGARLGELHESLANTTPFAHDVQRLLADFRDRGAQGAVLEVSSHALELHRVDGVAFDVTVLTNLTQDHLDFHGSFERYRDAKRKLFQENSAGKKSTAVLNVDDPEGIALATKLGQRLTYGISNPEAMFQATDISLTPHGSRFTVRALRPAPFCIRLPGMFNIANALAALTASCALDVDVEAMAEGLETQGNVPGRMLSIGNGEVGVYVDYAHTPDGMEQVLRAARGLTRGRLICVFGCGGNRDSSKRPVMGRIAQQLADHVVVTTDNPRHEDPQVIIDAILSGMAAELPAPETIVDRAAAIVHAISLARPGDVVVIAGKGHEQYQIVGDERHPFSDEAVARAAIEQLQ